MEEREWFKYMKTVSRSFHTNVWKETQKTQVAHLLIHFIPIGIKDQPGVWSCEVGMEVDRQVTTFLLHNMIGFYLIKRTKC